MYVIGIDGGGTKTEAFAVDLAGNLLGRFEGGATNPHAVTLPVAEQHLFAVLDHFFDKPEFPREDCLAVCLGIAGVDREEERAAFIAGLQKYVSELQTPFHILMKNDAEIALMAALGRNNGIIVISGTGSIVYGFTPSEERYRTGGWGHILGDKGSGYEIGLATLQAVMKSYDGVLPETALTQHVLDKHGFTSVQQLRTYIYQPSIKKQDIADYAQFCIQVAEQGDEIALRIIKEQAQELVMLTNALRNKHPFFEECQVAVTGSIFKYSNVFMDAFAQHLGSKSAVPQIVLSQNKPAYGAALQALEWLNNQTE